MGFYERVVFPRINDFAMKDRRLFELRQEALAPARGQVIEVGMGSGLNLALYPSSVERVIGIDPNPGMNVRAERRASAAPFPVEVRGLRGEALPLEDASVDTVVATFVLCTIADVSKALAEMHRVLKPEGQLLVLEHGLSDDPDVQRWQHRLNPVQRVVACGCNLNRNTRELVESARFRFESLRTFPVEGIPRPIGFVYLGRAVRA